MNRKNIPIIIVPYLIIDIIILVTFSFSFIPRDINISQFGWDLLNLLSLYQFIYLFSIWIGLILNLISICYLYYSNLKYATLYGTLGNVIILIMVLFHFFVLLRFNLLYIMVAYEFLFVSLLIAINYLIYYFLEHSPTIIEEASIRKLILDLGTKFTRLEIKEVSEKTKVDITSIIKIVKKMISNQEIHAYYFKSTKTLAFNQQLNINNIHDLMIQYNHWEDTHLNKKE